MYFVFLVFVSVLLRKQILIKFLFRDFLLSCHSGNISEFTFIQQIFFPQNGIIKKEKLWREQRSREGESELKENE